MTNIPTSQSKIRILYIDDEAENLRSFKANFRRDFTIFLADSAKEGLQILEKNKVEVILTDQKMPEMTGVEFLKIALKKYPETIRILVTGYSDVSVVKEALNTGEIYKYIEKPWTPDFMKMNIEKAYEVYALRKENKKLTADLIRVNRQLEFMLRQKLIS